MFHNHMKTIIINKQKILDYFNNQIVLIKKLSPI